MTAAAKNNSDRVEIMPLPQRHPTDNGAAVVVVLVTASDTEQMDSSRAERVVIGTTPSACPTNNIIIRICLHSFFLFIHTRVNA